MEPPRYRTLDGDEVQLPLAMDRWVLVPRGLARFDPELAWTLDYDDVPEPDRADPRLDFSAGALLVPVERWNERAALEPNLAPCRLTSPPSATVVTALAPTEASAAPGAEKDEVFRIRVAGIIGRAATACLVALAVGYVVAVTVWLWSLRHRVTGPDVSTGLLLVGAAVLLAWLAGAVGAVPRAEATVTPRARTRSGVVAGFGHFAEHPLGVLRLGLAIQLAGFAASVALR
jgi:hypothetical protein